MDDGVTRRPWAWLGWPVRVGPRPSGTTRASLRLDALTRPASFAARAIPVVLVVGGLALAAVSAARLDDVVSEGVATLGVEVGAALWFGGAVALILRRTTVGRALAVVVAALGGLALVGLALARGWTGARLELAMEFGVGALAIVVVDLVVLRALQPGLDAIGRSTAQTTVAVDLAWRWPPISVHVDPPDRAS